jgi:hypothetical protein
MVRRRGSFLRRYGADCLIAAVSPDDAYTEIGLGMQTAVLSRRRPFDVVAVGKFRKCR